MRIENLELSPGRPNLRVRELVPQPALQPGAEVVDPSKEKTKVSPGPEVWNPALRGRISMGFRAKAEGKILESENANGPLSPRTCSRWE